MKIWFDYFSSYLQVGFNFEYNSEKSKVSYQDECDIYYEKDIPGVSKTVILYNGLLELDTLIYPTILGSYYIKQTGINYLLHAKAAVFFLKLAIWNNLDYEVKIKEIKIFYEGNIYT